MSSAITVTDQNFADVTAAQRWVLFDLWSPNCQPCRALSPVIDDIAGDFAGEVTVCKVDVTAQHDLRERFAAHGLPTLALYRDGAEVDRVLGVVTRSQLVTWLESHL